MLWSYSAVRLVLVGSEGRIQNNEVLIQLEALRKWGTNAVNEIDREAFIATTAKIPWDVGETEQRRRTLIVEAMRWMNSTTADRGVKTEDQVVYMIKKGVERKSAHKIITKTTEIMFDEYARDNRRKREYCKKKQDQQEREEQRKKKSNWKRKDKGREKRRRPKEKRRRKRNGNRSKSEKD